MKSFHSIIITAIMFFLVSPRFLVSQESREVRRTVDLDAGGSVFIDTYKGSIAVETWNKPQVEIVAKIESDGEGGHEREKVRDTEIRIRSSSDRVEIRTDYEDVDDHGFSFFGLFGDNSGTMPFVHYHMMIPASATLKIKDYKSDTKISSPLASLTVETYKGTLIADRWTGCIDLETYKGEITIDFMQLSDECRFETYKGTIELRIPKGNGFRLDADLGRRADLDCDFDLNLKRKSRDDDYYRATVNGGGALLRVNTEKGNIRIKEK